MFFRPQGSGTRFSVAWTTIISAVWLALLGLLLWHGYFPATRGENNGLRLSTAESDDWFIIRIGGTYSGFGRSRQYRKENQWKSI